MDNNDEIWWQEDEGIGQQGGSGDAHNNDDFPVEDCVEDLAYMMANGTNGGGAQWKDVAEFNESIRATVDEARHQTFQLCKEETKFILDKVKKRLGRRSEKSLLNVANIFLDEDSKIWRVLDARLNHNKPWNAKDRLTHHQFFKCIMTLFVAGAYGQVRAFFVACT
jgi:hypothetical protein